MKLFKDNGNDYTLLIGEKEIRLLLLALSWAVEKSVAKEGAQTKPLTPLEADLRREYHSLAGQKNLLEQLIHQISKSPDRDLKDFIPPEYQHLIDLDD